MDRVTLPKIVSIEGTIIRIMTWLPLNSPYGYMFATKGQSAYAGLHVDNQLSTIDGSTMKWKQPFWIASFRPLPAP